MAERATSGADPLAVQPGTYVRITVCNVPADKAAEVASRVQVSSSSGSAALSGSAVAGTAAMALTCWRFCACACLPPHVAPSVLRQGSMPGSACCRRLLRFCAPKPPSRREPVQRHPSQAALPALRQPLSAPAPAQASFPAEDSVGAPRGASAVPLVVMGLMMHESKVCVCVCV